MEDKFDRIEKKYLITAKQKDYFLQQIHEHMQKDSYFKSEVFNIYFDTDNYDLIIQSIDQPIFKEKIRARSYGGYDRVFLEIKTKLRGKEYNLGCKRRVMITHKDFEQLVAHQATLVELSERAVETTNDLQVAKEIDYIINHFELKPQIIVIYDRESYKGDDGLRITFDENLKYRKENLSFHKAKHDKIFFEDDHNIIMEVKAHGVLPLWLVKAMSKQQAFPQQFSKIGKIYEQIMTTNKTRQKRHNKKGKNVQ